jgi:hypothetical protein
MQAAKPIHARINDATGHLVDGHGVSLSCEPSGDRTGEDFPAKAEGQNRKQLKS